MTERAMHVNDLKTSVERSSYVVDPRAVAEALLRRVGDARRARTMRAPRSPRTT